MTQWPRFMLKRTRAYIEVSRQQAVALYTRVLSRLHMGQGLDCMAGLECQALVCRTEGEYGIRSRAGWRSPMMIRKSSERNYRIKQIHEFTVFD
jgi:hypothetical protein